MVIIANSIHSDLSSYLINTSHSGTKSSLFTLDTNLTKLYLITSLTNTLTPFSSSFSSRILSRVFKNTGALEKIPLYTPYMVYVKISLISRHTSLDYELLMRMLDRYSSNSCYRLLSYWDIPRVSRVGRFMWVITCSSYSLGSCKWMYFSGCWRGWRKLLQSCDLSDDSVIFLTRYEKLWLANLRIILLGWASSSKYRV